MKMDGDVQYKKIAFQRYMWDTYVKKIKPIEEASMFDFYDTPLMTSGEVMAKPLVMLVGPYSSGKTTFINHVLGEAYPGAVTGIEPTTDAFTIVQSGANKNSPVLHCLQTHAITSRELRQTLALHSSDTSRQRS